MTLTYEYSHPIPNGELSKCYKAFNELHVVRMKLLAIVLRTADSKCCLCCDPCLACDAQLLLREIGER